MTDYEIRIAIAGEMGWTDVRFGDISEDFDNVRQVLGGIPPNGKHFPELPDFPNSLDACREFEETLDDEQAIAYENHLIDIVARDSHTKRSKSFIWHASARQRCEAYLRVKGLWKE